MSVATRPDGVRFVTFGCRLNAFETEIMREQSARSGLEGAIVFNTCAVTAEAVRQARQAIRRARRREPDARIVVTGCGAQTEARMFADMPEVDHIIGNLEKTDPSTLEQVCSDPSAPRVQVSDIMEARETANHLIAGFGTRARAFVQIQNGCDHRCTFCIIPFARGPSRSVPPERIVEQIAKLCTEGYAEIVLTGVDITSYGTDLAEAPRLGDLVRRILRDVPALQRLRISSIDSVEADDGLLDALSSEERLMPHLHLSLQSGDDMILKRMKRRHSARDAAAFCARARAARPDIVFGADLIAGFPTETEEMFKASLAHIADCGLTYLHVFPFSPRTGTPAARMPQLSRTVVMERAQRLREAGTEALDGFLASQSGAVRTILIERPGFGRSEHFAPTTLCADSPSGTIVQARIRGHESGNLIAEALS